MKTISMDRTIQWACEECGTPNEKKMHPIHEHYPQMTCKRCGYVVDYCLCQEAAIERMMDKNYIPEV